MTTGHAIPPWAMYATVFGVNLAVYFEPCWFGLFVTHDPKNADGVPVITRLHIGLIPCFPFRISWWNV